MRPITAKEYLGAFGKANAKIISEKLKIPLPAENKMRNERTVLDGIKFQSKKEANRYAALKIMQKAGLISGLKCQFPLNCWVNSHKVCSLVVDFYYFDEHEGKFVYEDVKGAKTGAAYTLFTLKKKLVNACLGIEVVEFF